MGGRSTRVDPGIQGEDTAILVSETAGLAVEGRYQEALTLFDQVRVTVFSSPEFLVKRTLTLDRIGLFSEVLKCCEEAISGAPRSADAWFVCGPTWYYYEAIDYFSKVVINRN